MDFRGHLQISWPGDQQGLQLWSYRAIDLHTPKGPPEDLFLVNLKLVAEIPPVGTLAGLDTASATGVCQE